MENFKSISSLEPFSFPLKLQGNLSYFDTLKRTLRLFEKLVNELKESDSVTISVKSELQGLKDSNKKILKVISSYLEGNSGKAYKTLDGLLKSPFYKSKLNSSEVLYCWASLSLFGIIYLCVLVGTWSKRFWRIMDFRV